MWRLLAAQPQRLEKAPVLGVVSLKRKIIVVQALQLATFAILILEYQPINRRPSCTISNRILDNENKR